MNGVDIDVFPPFTIHEGQFALYLADASGNASGSALFLGGKLEELTPEVTYAKQRVDRHGEPFGRTIHVDEEHRFTVKNLWVMQRSSNLMPAVNRSQNYVFKIRWLDKETQVWVVRTYYGVTIDGQALAVQDEVYHQNVPFTASYMEEIAGLNSPPSL
jgi:hypothetical protein